MRCRNFGSRVQVILRNTVEHPELNSHLSRGQGAMTFMGQYSNTYGTAISMQMTGSMTTSACLSPHCDRMTSGARWAAPSLSPIYIMGRTRHFSSFLMKVCG